MKCREGYLFASLRVSRNVFSAKGHPQHLRKITTLGRPSLCGSLSFALLDALSPITGGEAISTMGGGGVAHDFQDLGTSRLAKGFAKGTSSDCAPEDFFVEGGA